MLHRHSPKPEHVPTAYADMQAFHLAPMPVQSQERLTKAMRPQVRYLTLDSPWWDCMEGQQTTSLEMLATLDALLPSEAEVRAFYGKDIDPAEAARQLGRMGPRAVVVKIGARGSLVYNPQTDVLTHVPAYPCQAIDPTGAGDSFCGGFLVGLTETGDPVQAARYGTVSASFVIEGFGSLYALNVTRQQAEERLATLRALVSVKK